MRNEVLKSSPNNPAHPMAVDSVEPASGRSQSWQNIIWREWRHSEDKEYARQLFNLVHDASIDWVSVLVMALCGTLYGLLVGYLLGLIAANLNVPSDDWLLSRMTPLALAWVMGVTGGVVGVWTGRRISWSVWLALTTPGVFGKKMGDLGRFNLELLLGVMGGLIGLGFFGGLFLGGLFGNIRFGRLQLGRFDRSQRGIIFISALTGGLGAIAGSLFMQNSWLSIGVGLIIGVWFGITWGSGPLGIFVSWLGLLVGGLLLGLSYWLADYWLANWLVVGVGYGMGIMPNLPGRGIDPATAYNYRSWYFWWRGQPPTPQIKSALQLIETLQPKLWQNWRKALQRLKQQKAQPDQPERLIAGLQSDYWVDRFVARHSLIALGGETVEPLRKFAAANNSGQQTAIWLLASIEQDTTHRLARRVPRSLCPHCLARFGAHSVALAWGITFTYYGCRVCGQSREFLDWPVHVIAVLDAGWRGDRHRRDNELRVNWLKRRSLFDLNRIEIAQASDEEVERFAVQVGNDTDPLRQSRYKQIPCLIGLDCQLSENTLRILKSIFGPVE